MVFQMFPKHFIIVFLFLLFGFGVEGYEFGLCSKVGLTINAYSNANNELVYMYMADLTLSPADAYYTNISVSQQFAWSSDPSTYYQNVSSWPGCSVDGDCSFIYEDGPVWQTHSVMMDGEIVNFDLMFWYMIDQGTYYGVYETFNPKQPPCMPDGGGSKIKRVMYRINFYIL
uniref:Uncharacterized protein n=1 Tax=Panagrolaimus davidi TaxID=227884 RepID=A0A914P2V0_9BILA